MRNRGKKKQQSSSNSHTSSKRSNSSQSPKKKKDKQNDKQSKAQSNHQKNIHIQQQEKQQDKKQQLAKKQEEIFNVSEQISASYQAMKKQASQSQRISDFGASQNNKILLYLKQIHMKEQSIIVKGIKEMSEQSKKIIQELTNIQGEIDKYQAHTEEWIKKIQDLSIYVDKIRSVEGPFKKRSASISKLKDFLNVQKPRRR